MYDEIVMSVDLSADEVDLLNELLSQNLNMCTSIGEEITVQDLLEKLKE